MGTSSDLSACARSAPCWEGPGERTRSTTSWSGAPDSWAFRYDLGQCLPFGGRFPLYAVIHESCWADTGTTDWAAQRVRPAVFDDDPTLLTGEHVRREVFIEDTGLHPWLEVADLLAAHEWPALYDPARLKATTTPGAAAIYARDVFVPMTTSLETAALIPGLRHLDPPASTSMTAHAPPAVGSSSACETWPLE